MTRKPCVVMATSLVSGSSSHLGTAAANEEAEQEPDDRRGRGGHGRHRDRLAPPNAVPLLASDICHKAEKMH
jgi:hypothetical protein